MLHLPIHLHEKGYLAAIGPVAKREVNQLGSVDPNINHTLIDHQIY